MREIKHRGYSKLDNDWHYGLLQKDNYTGKYYINDYEDFDGFAYVEEDSIGQDTGFKDKNGEKIYEGDIVKYETYDEMDTYINKAEVYFCDELGMWMAEVEREGEIIGSIPLSAMDGKVEVIGNIYEEKLKENK